MLFNSSQREELKNDIKHQVFCFPIQILVNKILQQSI